MATRSAPTCRRRTTGPGRPGTTSASSCGARSSRTSRTRSPSAGTTRPASTGGCRGAISCSGSCTSVPRAPSCPSRARSRPTPAAGPYAVQVLRTYPGPPAPVPVRAGPVSGASPGPTSMPSRRARRLVYLEDQYLWSYAAAGALVDASVARARAARRHRDPAVPGSGRVDLGTGERDRASPRDAVARGRRRAAGRGVRPRQRGRRPDLRALQGLRRRRRVAGRRLRQPQSPVVESRHRDLLHDRRTRRARRTDRGSPRRPACASRPSISGSTTRTGWSTRPCGSTRSPPAPRPRGRGSTRAGAGRVREARVRVHAPDRHRAPPPPAAARGPQPGPRSRRPTRRHAPRRSILTP